MPLPTFDIWDQSVLTDVITRPDGTFGEGVLGDALGSKIAPLVPLQGRTAKVRTYLTENYDKGQFRAPDATPPLTKPEGSSYSESLVELALLDEMERIPEDEWMKLESPDENLARSVGIDIVARGRRLQVRNEKLTEWMRWQAFQGDLTITYPTGQQLYINYGIPAGHTPTVATPWTTTSTADPIADIVAWNEVVSDDSGHALKYLHMTSKTYDLLIKNAKIQSMLNIYSPSANTILRPRREDINALLTSFSQDIEIVVYDDGFRAPGATGYGRGSLTRYLPDYKVLATTDYVIDGVRIADTLDGQVTVSSSYNQVTVQQGFQSEVMLDHISKTHFLRAASARMPRLLLPDCFLWATVGTA